MSTERAYAALRISWALGAIRSKDVHANSATVIVRQTVGRFSSDVVEAMAFNVALPEEDFNPGETTDAIRRFLFANGGVAFTFDERRQWVDAGASGAGVAYVVELLGEEAVGVALAAILKYAWDLFKHDEAWECERFARSDDGSLKDELLAELERLLDLPRGSVEVTHYERSADRAYVIARHRVDGTRFGIRRFANGRIEAKVERA